MSHERHELGDTDSMLGSIEDYDQELRAYLAIEQGDYEEARRLLEPVASRGSIYSLVSLGALYERGDLESSDLRNAIFYYDCAASHGSDEAQRRLGQIWMDLGEDEKARTAFQYGAEAGNVSCMYWLGKQMLEGRGGAVDVCRGIEWLDTAAAKGHLFAKSYLLRRESRYSPSLFRRLLLWIRIFKIALQAGKAAAADPDVDILR